MITETYDYTEPELDIELQKHQLEMDQKLVAKKLSILENAYRQLELDRKKLEREKRSFEMDRQYEENSRSRDNLFVDSSSNLNFFAGVNNILALRKRYRDLCKIYHPDNLCGDTGTFREIKKEFEILVDFYEKK